MNEKEKLKIEIERLKYRSDYNKFEFNQYSTYYIGILAMLIAIYLPVIIYIKNISMILLLALTLVLSMFLSKLFIKRLSQRNLKNIQGISKEMNEKYNRLFEL